MRKGLMIGAIIIIVILALVFVFMRGGDDSTVRVNVDSSDGNSNTQVAEGAEIIESADESSLDEVSEGEFSQLESSDDVFDEMDLAVEYID
jgi:hypothetical protein